MAELQFRPCHAEHIALIYPQSRDKDNKMMYLNPGYAQLLSDSFALSAWAGNACVGAAGIVHIHKHRSMAWALLSEHSGPYMRQITKKIREALDLHSCPRVEMTVACDFELGHRWAKLLGFELEASCMRKSGVFGGDEALYARIK